MSRLNEKWASLTQDERDEMNEKDRKGRIKSLAMKYGRRRVDNAQNEAESDAKRSGRNTKKRPITWRELQGRIENSSKLKRGEVRKWDKEKGKWVSNKEDVNEKVDSSSKSVYGDGHDYTKGLAVTGRLDFGKGKKSEYDVGLSYKGSVLARKTKKYDKPEKTSPKKSVGDAIKNLERNEKNV